MTETTLNNMIINSGAQGIKNESEFIMDKDTVITHESAITVRSRSSSSIADKSASYYSDDAESSHDSFDTIATSKSDEKSQNEKDVIETNISGNNGAGGGGGRRRRALTVTQNSREIINNQQEDGEVEEEEEEEEEKITTTTTDIKDQSITTETTNYDHIQELQQSTSLLGNQDYSDSDSIEDDDDFTSRRHKRHESHRSTISSIYSVTSSASNYDLLLARLGSKDTSSSLDTINNTTAQQEIRTSFERVYNEAVNKGEDEDIDWGKLRVPLLLLVIC